MVQKRTPAHDRHIGKKCEYISTEENKHWSNRFVALFIKSFPVTREQCERKNYGKRAPEPDHGIARERNLPRRICGVHIIWDTLDHHRPQIPGTLRRVRECEAVETGIPDHEKC